jgi:hypothetical protein
MWAGGLQPGDAFDASHCLPILQSMINDGTLGEFRPEARALVPGCGRGYEVGFYVAKAWALTGLAPAVAPFLVR